LRYGYHQVWIKDEDIHKIAFRARYGNCKFVVVSLGITNAPATCMFMMNNVLIQHLKKFVSVFVDDTLVYLMKTKEEHEEN